MRKLFELDLKDYSPDAPVFVRPSVRAIIRREGKLAMIHSLTYDYYKFPGGGIEAGEEPLAALCREVREEAGLVVLPSTVQPYGQVRRIQRGDYGDTFVQENDYYLCDVEAVPVAQQLDDYEAEERFTLEWTDAPQAITVNRRDRSGDAAFGRIYTVMLEREARVLEMLIDEGLV